jgi:phosphatidylglycerol:prolipoprotein diacylglycerol transferase
LGYRIQLVPTDLSPAQAHPLLCFSTGQVFSFCMVVVAILWFFVARRLPGNEAVRVYPNAPVSGGPPTEKALREREEARKNRRKLRKRLK